MISKLIRCKLTFKYLRRLNFNSEICVWLERGNIINKSKEKILIKKEKLILSYLLIIISIFGIFFYRFIIVDGFGFFGSIIILIIGVSTTILLLKEKLTHLKVRKDNDLYLIVSILGYIVCVAHFLFFILDPYGNAVFLTLSLFWFVSSVYSTLLYIKLREIKP
jgi:hypothetical protein